MISNLYNSIDASLYGGKASGLASMLRAQLPVPGGVAFSWDEEPSSSHIFYAMIESSLTKRDRFAVRSSAIGEDSKEDSFAGQHDTILNVPWLDVPSAFERVRGSLYNKRAAIYRKVRSVKSDLRMGIVIQKMVPNVEMSAILFTKDPVSGVDDFNLEYHRGLGDRLVSGEVTPESVTIPRSTHLCDRLCDCVPPELCSLLRYARTCEILIGGYADIEAAYNGEWWLCQVRPVTT